MRILFVELGRLFERSSWLPLMLGHGTYYVDACPHMSFFLAGGAP